MTGRETAISLLLASLAVAACSGGGGGGSPRRWRHHEAGAAVAVSGASPFPSGCGDTAGTVYVNGRSSPPRGESADPAHLLAVWQQDRWSNGSARGSWRRSPSTAARRGPAAVALLAMRRGYAGNGGGFERATDPWVAFGADGSA